MKFMIVFIAPVLLNIIGCNDNPVDGKSENRSPVILSLTVFPEVVKPNDSLIVICNAMDPDGDTLVYDWITDGRLRIKGTNNSRLYHTTENSRVFYPKGNINIPIDTLWVQCFTRDVKGGADAKIVLIIVR